MFRLLLKIPFIKTLVPSIKFKPLYLFFLGTTTNSMPSNVSKPSRKSVPCNQNFLTAIDRKTIAVIGAYLRNFLLSTCSLLKTLIKEDLAGSEELGYQSISKVKYDQAVAMNSALVSLRIP